MSHASNAANPESAVDSHPVDADHLLHAVERVVSDKLQPLLDAKSGAAKRKPEEPRLRYRGNRMQYEFNTEVLGYIRRVEKCIAEEDADRAKRTIVDCRAAIQERNKHIRMADRSVHGWNTVDEYMSDDLASDSDDEKRMRAAEDRAAKKKSRGAAAARRFQGPRRGGYPSQGFQARGSGANSTWPGYPSFRYPSYMPPGQFPVQVVPPPWCGPGQFPSGPRAKGPAGPRGGRGGCHRCGDPKHWVAECPFPPPDE